MPWKMRWAQVRRMIDSGKTREKVGHPDPAAAPLGTDEEAGGVQTPPEAVADSAEKRPGGRRPDSEQASEDHAPDDDEDAAERNRQ